jgi:hypothetical protein
MENRIYIKDILYQIKIPLRNLSGGILRLIYIRMILVKFNIDICCFKTDSLHPVEFLVILYKDSIKMDYWTNNGCIIIHLKHPI